MAVMEHGHSLECNNTNTPSPEDDGAAQVNPDQECKTFLFITYVIIFGGMCVFGLIGNTLSFMVLQWERQNFVATFLLQVMALADNLFLTCTGFAQITPAVMLYTNTTENLLNVYMPAYVWPLVHITQLGTVWITVLIAFNRYIAICKPFQAPLVCTRRKVQIQVLLMTLCIVIYNVPRFLEYQVVVKEDPATNTSSAASIQTAMKQDHIYNIVYENILYCLFVFLGPLLILCCLNTCLVLELMAARKRLIQRNLPRSREDEEHNLTLVMIVIILIFLVCQTPAFLNQLLYYGLADSAYSCGKAYYHFFHISNLLVSANSSLNFVVYCVFREQFRSRLKAFCQHRRLGLKHTNSYHYDGKTTSVYSTNGDTLTMNMDTKPEAV